MVSGDGQLDDSRKRTDTLCRGPAPRVLRADGASPLLGRLWQAVRSDLSGFAAALRPHPAPKVGLHAYPVQAPGGSRRIHLRVEDDGSGLLLIDVTDAIHLNPTATLLAYYALEGVPRERAAAQLRLRFPRVEAREIAGVTAAIYDMIEHLRGSTSGCPTCGLGDLSRTALFSAPLGAPYKADLALTYACNNACPHCYNPAERRSMRSLDVAAWRRVLDRLAAIGVPHVVFTGGEPTLFGGLQGLIRHASRLGLVAGMNTSGRRLAEPGFARSLAESGLDHVQITVESPDAEVHNAMTGADSFDDTVAGIRRSLAAGLHTITNTTLTRRNVAGAERLVDWLDDLGVRTFAANGMIQAGCGRGHADALREEELGPVLVALRDRAAECGMRFLWYTPTRYCRLSPVELEVGIKRCNAGQYTMCIEPNGDVLPCQSFYEPVGNVLRDPWPIIWNSPLFLRFRNRTVDPEASGLPAECRDCPDLAECAGGCPLERRRKTSEVFETSAE